MASGRATSAFCCGPRQAVTATAALGKTRGAADSQAGTFPRKSDFQIADGYTYLNAAYTHPIPKVSLDAVRSAAVGRSSMPPPSAGAAATPKTLFAELINAKPSEIAYVSSTSAGENLVVQALELDRSFDGNVVTDGLHFEGAILHLLELRKQGLDVRVVKPTNDVPDRHGGSGEGRSTGRRGSSRSRPPRCTTASSTTSRPSATWRTRTARTSTPTSSTRRAPSRST